jgi:hypothetical protein
MLYADENYAFLLTSSLSLCNNKRERKAKVKHGRKQQELARRGSSRFGFLRGAAGSGASMLKTYIQFQMKFIR